MVLVALRTLALDCLPRPSQRLLRVRLPSAAL
jgi:hypothetical protein